MDIALPSETIFHTIESTIKTYRKYSQLKIAAKIQGITIDQGLALIYISKHPDMSQKALAELLFKDTASLTRMINAMVKHGFIKRTINPDDLRRYKLMLTKKGKSVVKQLPAVISSNRLKALKNISKKDIDHLKQILTKIKTNCKT